MVMRTFRLSGKPNHLEFTNYERKNEKVIFHEIMSLLQKNSDIAIGDKQTGPSEDYYECTISGLSFTLMNDINYGLSIYSKESKALEMLIEYLD